MRTPVIRAIGASHAACKYEFRQNLQSHSWSVFYFYNVHMCDVRLTPRTKQTQEHVCTRLMVVWRFPLSLARDRLGLVVRRSLTSEPRPTAWAPRRFPLSFPVLFRAPINTVLGLWRLLVPKERRVSSVWCLALVCWQGISSRSSRSSCKPSGRHALIFSLLS